MFFHTIYSKFPLANSYYTLLASPPIPFFSSLIRKQTGIQKTRKEKNKQGQEKTSKQKKVEPKKSYKKEIQTLDPQIHTFFPADPPLNMKHNITTCKQKNCKVKRKKENEKRRIPEKVYGIMRQNNLQIPLSFVCMGHLLVGKRPALKCGLYMTDTAQEKTNFYLQVCISWRQLLG